MQSQLEPERHSVNKNGLNTKPGSAGRSKFLWSGDTQAQGQLSCDHHSHSELMLWHLQNAFDAHRDPGGKVWDELHPPESNIKVLIPNKNVILFENRIFVDVIKLG